MLRLSLGLLWPAQTLLPLFILGCFWGFGGFNPSILGFKPLALAAIASGLLAPVALVCALAGAVLGFFLPLKRPLGAFISAALFSAFALWITLHWSGR